MANIPSLVEMLEAGVHFGHQAGRWHPKMAPYIFTQRNGVHVINLEVTREKLAEVVSYIEESVAAGKTVLFLGTKKQVAPIVRAAAERAGMPFIVDHWIGGFITNFGEIKKLIKKYNSMKKAKEAGEWAKYTKKEQSMFEKELEQMDLALAGINTVESMPDILYVVDMRTEKTAVTEANMKKVPIVGLCDTNVNPLKATYVIPANDDAVRSVELVSNVVADAVLEGRRQYEKNQKATLKVEKKEKRVEVTRQE